MLFNSPEFFVFAALFFLLWYPVRVHRYRLCLIVLASFVFYSWWDWRFLSLLLLSGLVDFAAGLLIQRRPRLRKLWLCASMASNLAILVSFKYLGFLAGLFCDLTGVDPQWAAPFRDIVLPVGISFYTFQSMSYTIDVYRGEMKPTSSLLHFFSYLALFPQLVAGPIERGAGLMPQLASTREPTPRQFADGWVLLVAGFFKKSLIADNIAPYVDAAFRGASPGDSWVHWWAVAAMFAVQIYCDFAGYTDIARGLGKFMGIDLRKNFDHPYRSASFREFWTRWHISLSTWFRDYVYIPLGGGRKGAARGYANLWITMLLSGLWHGAGLTFLLWAAMHATYLTLERLAGRAGFGRKPGTLGGILGQLAVSAGVLLAWIAFRAESVGQALRIMGTMLTFGGTDHAVPWTSHAGVMLAAGAIFYLWDGMRVRFVPRVDTRNLVFWLLPAAAVLAIFFRGPGNAFIYFQF